jgi:hypothetical protein
MKTALSRLDRRPYSSLDDSTRLLWQRIEQFSRFYIFIDGIDACEPLERQKLFHGLFPPSADSSGFKAYLTSRETLPEGLRDSTFTVESLSMACSAAESDINLFAREELRIRMDRKDSFITDC